MSILVNPLDLILDLENPRFVRIDGGDLSAIRKYMATFEDVCSLANDINNNNGLLLGERIVVIQENGQYLVMEGNRRTCALQFLLDRNLIPNGFQHRIPTVNPETLRHIGQIDVDVAPDRDYAVNLMGKRHITGVKRWKPLAKKRFFAGMFIRGNTINDLSSITGISSSEIRKDIRDYKFLLSASRQYKVAHPEFNEDIISYEISRFLRIFDSKQQTREGLQAAREILKIRYDDREDTLSDLPTGLFEQIVELVFQTTIVDGTVTTRRTLFDVPGVESLLETELGNLINGPNSEPPTTPFPTPQILDTTPRKPSHGTIPPTNVPTPMTTPPPSPQPMPGGPTPGGDPPPTFFEHISWHGKLDPANQDHVGLIVALNELYNMSTNTFKVAGRYEKIYSQFPVGAGMLFRTAYEQALKLQLKKTGLWDSFIAPFLKSNSFPMLSKIESHTQTNASVALPKSDMRSALSRIIRAAQREFLNGNIHDPGIFRATPATLEGIASGGMFTLIQLIIDDL